MCCSVVAAVPVVLPKVDLKTEEGFRMAANCQKMALGGSRLTKVVKMSLK